MKFLQKLGRALLLPVACLPLCGILMGIGYMLAPGVMQPNQPTEGLAYLIGLFLIKAGGALVDNIPLLFVIGVGVGLSERNDGTGALSALTSWLMMTTLLNKDIVAQFLPFMVKSESNALAFDKIQNVFIGIIAGIIGALCFNKFKDRKLPDWLSFFNGKRCVAIISGLVSIMVSIVLAFVWPTIFSALVTLGKSIVGLKAVGAGIYAFFNRLLIPIGLHHALNNVFYFDMAGINDLGNFWSGKTSADVGHDLGMYMSGFFPCMMFGIPGAALAMIMNAKPAKKKVAIGLVASAAVCSFICGVTEPFEFGFVFLAPILYLVYALLYGIFVAITVAVGFRAGFSFSAGLTDLIFSASLPAAQKTWMILPLGIAAFMVFFSVFYFIIKKFDLKTVGREDDDEDDVEEEEDIEADIDVRATNKKTKVKKSKNNSFAKMAEELLEALGGKDNIESIDNCITRLRLEVKDRSIIDDNKIKEAGASGVVKPGKSSVQVIIGTKVQFVADEFKKLCE